MPKRVKKTRPVVNVDGSSGGYEEYYDWIFPDDNTGAANLKILEMAKKWKKKTSGGDEPAPANKQSSEEIDLGDI